MEKWKLRRYAVSGLSSEEIAKSETQFLVQGWPYYKSYPKVAWLGTTGKNIQIKLKISRQLLSHHMRELRINDLIEPAEEKRGLGGGFPVKASLHWLIP